MLLPFLVRIVIDGEFPLSSDTFTKCVNCFTFCIFNGTPIEADKDVFFTQVGLPLWKPVFSLLTQHYFWHSVRVAYPTVPGDQFQQFPVLNYSGRPALRLQSSTIVRVRLNTALRGRRYRGFKLIGPIAVLDTEGDMLTPEATTAWSQAVGVFTQTFLAVQGSQQPFDLFPVVWSQEGSVTGGPVGSGEGAVVTSVTLLRTLGRCRHRRMRTPPQ